MDRRKFLGIASYTGLTVAGLHLFGRTAGASPGVAGLTAAGRSPLFLMIHAAGGWDPTSLCDPKGAASDTDRDAMNWSYRARDIVTTPSGIRHAPLASFHRFFARHDRRLRVINGIDTGTRNHEVGARHMGSGRLDEGAPSFAALLAAARGRELEMGYLSFGGYDETLGEVDLVRSADAGPRDRVVHPDRPDPDAERTIFDADSATIRGPHAAPLALTQLQRHLPRLDAGPNPLLRQIQVAMAAYRAGLTVAVNLELDGFDTHADHDATHIPRLAMLLEALDFTVDEAERQGLADDYVAVVGSEFGRSPGYNADNGKDHWPVTSMLAMGRGVGGGRVVGGTTDRHEALPVDPRTLAVRQGGVRITPRHIHHGLRRLAGITDHPVARTHALDDADELDLFGG